MPEINIFMLVYVFHIWIQFFLTASRGWENLEEQLKIPSKSGSPNSLQLMYT